MCVDEAAKMSARVLVTLLAVSCAVSAQSDVENRAREFLKRFDEEATPRMYQFSLASWAYNTNITKENSDKLVSTGRLFKIQIVCCRLVSAHEGILMFLFSFSHKRDKFGTNSTPRSQKSLCSFPSTRSRIQKSNYSSCPYKTKALVPCPLTKLHM